MTVTDEKTIEKVSRATDRASERFDEAADSATRVAREAAGSASEVVREADRALRESPDEVLGIVAAFSVGMAVGMIATGAPRLFVLAALAPAALVAWILIDRREREGGRRGQSPSRG